MSNLPWIEKYRPHSLEDIIGQKHIVDCVRKLIQTKHFPNMIFSGPQSTGKTTLALCIINELCTDTRNILELNASDARGIDTVRDVIYKFAITHSNELKIIILDEIDAMTHEAQIYLNYIIDKFSLNCRFIFICNYINKIEQSLLSRCVSFVFNKLNTDFLLTSIIKLEKEDFQIEDKQLLIKLLDYDIRKIYNTIQLLQYYDRTITNDVLYDFLNMPSLSLIQNIYQLLKNNSNSIRFKFDTINKMIVSLSFNHIINELFNYSLSIEDFENISLFADIELKMLVANNYEINLLYLIAYFI